MSSFIKSKIIFCGDPSSSFQERAADKAKRLAYTGSAASANLPCRILLSQARAAKYLKSEYIFTSNSSGGAQTLCNKPAYAPFFLSSCSPFRLLQPSLFFPQSFIPPKNCICSLCAHTRNIENKSQKASFSRCLKPVQRHSFGSRLYTILP